MEKHEENAKGEMKMEGITGFENKYKKAISAIAKAENISCVDARGMLVYFCRQYEKGAASESSIMNFEKLLGKDFDFATCLSDFQKAISDEAAFLAS